MRLSALLGTTFGELDIREPLAGEFISTGRGLDVNGWSAFQSEVKYRLGKMIDFLANVFSDGSELVHAYVMGRWGKGGDRDKPRKEPKTWHVTSSLQYIVQVEWPGANSC